MKTGPEVIGAVLTAGRASPQASRAVPVAGKAVPNTNICTFK
jgi:hypothetical protein